MQKSKTSDTTSNLDISIEEESEEEYEINQEGEEEDSVPQENEVEESPTISEYFLDESCHNKFIEIMLFVIKNLLYSSDDNVSFWTARMCRVSIKTFPFF